MENTITKSITIPKEHQDWIEQNNINLSRFVQTKIQEMIDKQKRRGNSAYTKKEV